jgi:hypothetical protein
MLRLRPHHLLCLRLFEGRGYDEAFTARMRGIASRMNARPGERFALAAGADDICAACPNRTASDSCLLGDGDVSLRDGRALDALGLGAGSVHSFGEVGERIKERMTQETFEGVCGGCRWRETGVCTYDKFMAATAPEDIGRRTDREENA